MRNYASIIKRSFTEHVLPADIISQIVLFKCLGNKDGYLKFDGLDIGKIPPTPRSREAMVKADDTSDMIVMQCASLLGEPIGYIQESAGELVNNFFPHPDQAKALNSDSCDSELEMHTENAFHEYCPDYLILLCLRQDPAQEAITYITSVDHLLPLLSDDDRQHFFTEKYNFLSDYSEDKKNCRVDINKYEPVLYGDHDAPCFRFDPHFMVAASDKAQQKMEALRALVWQLAVPIKMAAGTLLIIDNRKTCHARSPFPATFDGRDRWVQRGFSVSAIGNNAKSDTTLPVSKIAVENG